MRNIHAKLKFYMNREYTYSHDIPPPFPCHVLMTYDFLDQHFYCLKQKLTDGSSEQYLKYLLTNAVFFFKAIKSLSFLLQSPLDFFCSEISFDSLCQLNVLRHYDHSFCMNGTYICLF